MYCTPTMRTWSTVQAALEGRPGWRRRGQEYHGPCPVLDVGRDCCWLGPGDGSGGVRVGCRRCGAGGALSGPDVRAHLDALCGPPPSRDGGLDGRQPRSAAPKKPKRAAVLPDEAWRESGPVASGPGLEYLERRGVWPGYPVPSVRWLTASAAARIRLYPRLPVGASGALVYRFAVPGELGAVRTVQVEAVDADGTRRDRWRYWDRALGIEVERSTKRPSAAGSDTDGGRRVFFVPSARAPAPGVHVCEGPVDALGLVALETRGLVDLGGSAVIGVAGTSGLQPAAVAAWDGPVTIWPDGDGPGRGAAAVLASTLERDGRGRVTIRRQAPGEDIGRWAADAAAEREAMRDG